MLITRRALLISNPGEIGQENYCKGVYADIKNYQQLLESAEGGAWDLNNEVTHLDRPSAQTVRSWIADSYRFEYVFIMFTGHGWYSSPDADRVLELRAGERIAGSDLATQSSRRTIILDCCQKVHPESMTERFANAMVMASAGRVRTPDREICRNLFSEAVQNAPRGVLKTVSCSINEVSTDDDSLGGRYNHSLLKCVQEWISGEARRFNSTAGETLSIVKAHECASTKTQALSGGLQNPTIEKPRTGPYFPIAVFG